MKKLLTAAAMMFFFSMVCLCNSGFSMDNEPGTYIVAQQNQQEAAEKDEDYDKDEEFEEASKQL